MPYFLLGIKRYPLNLFIQFFAINFYFPGSFNAKFHLVTINIDSDDVPLRPGMTANASIVVQEMDNALIVPNWAIRLDRETGLAYVNRLNGDNSIEEVAVVTATK